MESCEDGSVDADHAEGPPSPSSSSTSHVDTTTEEGDTSEIATDGKCAEIPAGTSLMMLRNYLVLCHSLCPVLMCPACLLHCSDHQQSAMCCSNRNTCSHYSPMKC